MEFHVKESAMLDIRKIYPLGIQFSAPRACVTVGDISPDYEIDGVLDAAAW